jgi:hypothetical protein
MIESGHGTLSPFTDKVQAIFRCKDIRFERIENNPTGGYHEKCLAAVEAHYRALSPTDRAVVEGVLRWPA